MWLLVGVVACVSAVRKFRALGMSQVEFLMIPLGVVAGLITAVLLLLDWFRRPPGPAIR